MDAERPGFKRDSCIGSDLWLQNPDSAKYDSHFMGLLAVTYDPENEGALFSPLLEN